MTKILYIPAGQFMTYPFNDYLETVRKRTTDLEEALIKDAKQEIIDIIRAHPACYFRIVNNLPEVICEEEFEVVYD